MGKSIYGHVRNPKLVVVLGPTATGKSDLAVTLAKKFGGEVISADSRQVYQGLNIGTGKITKKEMRGVPHHLLNVANPKRQFTVAEYKEFGDKILEDVWRRNKLPIVCGGTGFYIQALIDGIVLPEVPPNKRLRKQLEKKSAGELFLILKKLDVRRAREIDAKNPRRLIRAIEIAKHLGNVPYLGVRLPSGRKVLKIGIDIPDEELKKRIRMRLLARIKKGMVAEAKRLHQQGLSWKRMEELGLEYRYLARHLQRKITKEQMIERLGSEIWHYAKRQRTWFKRDKRITWFLPQEKQNIMTITKNFLSVSV